MTDGYSRFRRTNLGRSRDGDSLCRCGLRTRGAIAMLTPDVAEHAQSSRPRADWIESKANLRRNLAKLESQVADSIDLPLVGSVQNFLTPLLDFHDGGPYGDDKSNK